MKISKKIFFALSILVLFVIFISNHVKAYSIENYDNLKEVLSRSNFIDSDNKITTSSSINLVLDLIGEDTCGNTKEQAKNMEINTTIKESINYKEDIDVYKIEVLEKSHYLIESKIESAYLNAVLLNENGKILSNLNGGKIIFSEDLKANKPYYLIVWHEDFKNGLGEYEISLEAKPDIFDKKHNNSENDLEDPNSMDNESIGSYFITPPMTIEIGQEVLHPSYNPYEEFWYTFQADNTVMEGYYTINIMEPFYLRVYDEALVLIADNIVGTDYQTMYSLYPPESYLGELNLFLEPSKNYFICVTDASGGLVNFIVNLNANGPPIIEGVENDAIYDHPVSVNARDDKGIASYELRKGSQIIENYILGDTLYENGWYTFSVYDTDGELSSVGFRIDIENGNIEIIPDSNPIDEATSIVSLSLRRVGVYGKINLDYFTTDGTAVINEDYTSNSGSIEWLEEDYSDKTIQIEILDDNLPEDDESLEVHFNVTYGYADLPKSIEEIIILDNDQPDKNLLIEKYDAGKALHDSAQEGTQDEEYMVGSKNEFLVALDDAKEIIDLKTSTQEEVDLELQNLDDAIGTFQNKIMGDDFDRAINASDYEINGVYNYEGDYDYFKVIPLESNKYKIENVGQSDVQFKLYDENKNEISLNGNVNLIANKTYYIKVFSSSTSVGLNYNIRLELAFSGNIEYEYDNAKLRLKYIKLDDVRVIEFIYDNNGNLVEKIKIGDF